MRVLAAACCAAMTGAMLFAAPAEALPAERCAGLLGAAHRGVLGKGHAENTVPAFLDALTLGMDAAETDVQITADGAFMLMHDRTIDRTTDGTGAIADLTSDYVRSVHTTDGGQVPFLAEALTAVHDAGGQMLLEMKTNPYWSADTYAAFVASIYDAQMEGQVVVTSSHRNYLGAVDTLAPEIETAWKGPDGATAAQVLRYADSTTVQPMWATRDFIAEIHAGGGRVIIGKRADRNRPYSWEQMIARGADGFLSDRSAALVTWCSSA